ncbi:two-component system sensor histidine kinase YesM [Hydrogenispora ethanolica]|uniref:histidine kinase n=1 Tax=Hydrogenispora ethanolica TaxID=1082276 RepID=A0A4R1RHA8_HYDET|nr:sensor histidine kinase [Hydrogenispora ethanolica]TCL65316.1 two-component system sensor histidine kinase YesM [Hydrogenispora ethanolica]
MKLNYFYKLLLSFTAIIIVPLVVTGVIAYGLLTEILTGDASRQAYESIVQISQRIDDLNEELGALIDSLSRDPAVRSAVLQDSLSDYQSLYQRLSSLGVRHNIGIFVLSAQGRAVFAKNTPPAIYNPTVYQNWGIFRAVHAAKQEPVIYGHHYLNSKGETVVYSLAKAILEARGQIIGYLIFEVSKKQILAIRSRISTNLNLDLVILDQNFYIIADFAEASREGTFFRSNQQAVIRAKASGVLPPSRKERERLLVFDTSPRTGLVTVGVLSPEIVFANRRLIRWIILSGALASLLICLAMALLIARSISRPVRELVACMKRVEKGDLAARVDFRRGDELGVLGNSFNSMVERIKDLLDKVIEKQRRVRNSEIKALKAQINPHFLYNTLDSVNWLAQLNHVTEISVIVTELGQLLRNSISNGNDFSTVAESLETIQSYLRIQKIRYSDKFTAAIEVDPAIQQCQIPKLILQPLVENAIIHGLESKVGQGVLTVRGYQEGAELVFEISDNGVGISKKQLAALNREMENEGDQASSSIGIPNVNRRIKLYYGNEYGLTIRSRRGRGTQIILRLPAVAQGEKDYA